MNSLFAFVVGVVSAIVGIHFRESLRHAHRQKILASKLESQLNSLEDQLIDLKLAPFLAAADQWNAERLRAYELSGHQRYADVENKYKSKLSDLKQKIIDGQPDIDSEIETNWDFYSSLPESLFLYTKNQYEIVRDGVLSGAMLMDDNEGAELSWVASSGLIKVRNLAIDLIHRNIMFTLMCREMANLELEALRPLTAEHAERMVFLTRELRPLRQFAKSVREMSPTKLALKGIAKGA